MPERGEFHPPEAETKKLTPEQIDRQLAENFEQGRKALRIEEKDLEQLWETTKRGGRKVGKGLKIFGKIYMGLTLAGLAIAGGLRIGYASMDAESRRTFADHVAAECQEAEEEGDAFKANQLEMLQRLVIEGEHAGSQELR